MKLNKQILEAIHRGINLALDDFDDNELVGQQTETIKDTHYTKDYLALMENFVDLGLPSRTLWCKYNLGVDPNNLKTIIDWFGNYYAWGEIEPKYTRSDISNNKNIVADWSNYKWTPTGLHDYLTKYCTSEDYGADNCGIWYVDNLTKLQPEDDAVFQNMHIGNFKCYIPTKEQFDELLNNTTDEIVYSYQGINDLKGRLFKSKINGNELFIPYCSYVGPKGANIDYNIYDNSFYFRDGYLWSSTVYADNPSKAFSLGMSADIDITRDNRCIAFPVRAVVKI